MPEPTAYTTAAQRVVFFEDRAEVTRTGKVSVTDGRQWVRLSGASLLLDDRSVQARALADRVKVLSARVIRKRRDVNTLQPDEYKKLQDAIAEAAKIAAELDSEYNRIGRQATYLYELFQSWTQAIATVPKPGQDSPVAEFAQAFQTLIERDDGYLKQQDDLLDRREDANAEHSRRLEEFSRRNLTQTLFECFVEVQLDSSTGNDIELEIKYRVPAALWRPEHMARLDRDKAELEWTTWGVVWHRTGEEWKDVEIAFSTARPAQVADAPNLSDDYLSLRKKTAEERKQVVVQMREETISETGERAEAEMPGVDDGGKPLEFTPKGRYALPGTGQPTRVEISRTRLKAVVSRTLLPERAQTAFLKAEANWSGDAPILAGPLKLARGGAVVGRSRVKFVASGEKFETGFGAEDGIRCKRAVSEERETAKLTGAQTIKRGVTLRLSNLGNDARELEITERVPVSEIEGLEVKLAESKDWKLDKDGYLTHKLTLQPRANVTLDYEYEIRAKSNVVLPF